MQRFIQFLCKKLVHFPFNFPFLCIHFAHRVTFLRYTLYYCARFHASFFIPIAEISCAKLAWEFEILEIKTRQLNSNQPTMAFEIKRNKQATKQANKQPNKGN